MTDDETRNSLEETIAQLAKRLELGANLAPVKDREEWEQIVARKPPEERELLQELARFIDIWRYFRERNERLGIGIMDAIQGLHDLPIPERIERLKQINLQLMERVGDDGKSARSRN